MTCEYVDGDARPGVSRRQFVHDHARLMPHGDPLVPQILRLRVRDYLGLPVADECEAIFVREFGLDLAAARFGRQRQEPSA